MTVDLTKLSHHSRYNAFKNNNEYTGTLTISGATDGGTNTRTYTISLAQAPDLLDVQFNGPPHTASDSRPSDAWFRRGAIGVPFTGVDDSKWVITSKISGSDVIVTAIFVYDTAGAETLTSTDFTYKIVDYSVF